MKIEVLFHHDMKVLLKPALSFLGMMICSSWPSAATSHSINCIMMPPNKTADELIAYFIFSFFKKLSWAIPACFNIALNVPSGRSPE